jgi:hypothetical protein
MDCDPRGIDAPMPGRPSRRDDAHEAAIAIDLCPSVHNNEQIARGRLAERNPAIFVGSVIGINDCARERITKHGHCLPE